MAAMLFRNSKSRPFAIIGIFGSVLILWLPPTPNGWTVMPDYHVWLVPIALATMVLMEAADRLRLEVFSLLVGGITAVMLATKLSVVAFAMPLVACMLRRMPGSRRVLTVGLTAIAGFCLVLALILIAFFPDVATFAASIEGLRVFIRAQTATLPANSTLWRSLVSQPYLLVVLIAHVLLAAYAIIWRRIEAFGVAVGALLLTTFVAYRFYSHSFIELHSYLFFEMGLVVLGIARSTSIHARQPRVIAIVAAALLLIVILGWSALWPRPVSLLTYSESLQKSSDAFDARIHANADDVWILTTGDAYRPNSIHSALCKGGTDIFAPYWGTSRYITDLFSNFHCAVVQNGVVQQDLTTSTLGFLRYPDEAVDDAVKRVESYFSVVLDGHDCLDMPASNFGYVVCDPRVSDLRSP